MVFHGRFDENTKNCHYFVEARKICFVVDQENDYYMHKGYENYRCNYINRDQDYVMFFNMRWHSNKEPTLSDYTFGGDLVFDVLFNKAPEVRTLETLDVHNFDFDSRNYNLEFTIMLVLSLLSLIVAAIFIIYGNKSMF
jgi:hypothetical protein